MENSAHFVKYTISESRMTDNGNDKQKHNATTADSIQTEKIKMVDVQAVMSQPVGQAFISKNGGEIYHARFPLFDDNLTESVGSIESYSLGAMIRDVNLKQFVFNDDKYAIRKNIKHSIINTSDVTPITSLSDFE